MSVSVISIVKSNRSLSSSHIDANILDLYFSNISTIFVSVVSSSDCWMFRDSAFNHSLNFS